MGLLLLLLLLLSSSLSFRLWLLSLVLVRLLSLALFLVLVILSLLLLVVSSLLLQSFQLMSYQGRRRFARDANVSCGRCRSHARSLLRGGRRGTTFGRCVCSELR